LRWFSLQLLLLRAANGWQASEWKRLGPGEKSWGPSKHDPGGPEIKAAILDVQQALLSEECLSSIEENKTNLPTICWNVSV
jgi:hypothetical protein